MQPSWSSSDWCGEFIQGVREGEDGWENKKWVEGAENMGGREEGRKGGRRLVREMVGEHTFNFPFWKAQMVT